MAIVSRVLLLMLIFIPATSGMLLFETFAEQNAAEVTNTIAEVHKITNQSKTNEVGFNGELRQYYLNLSEDVKYESLQDILKSKRAISIAYVDLKDLDYNASLKSGYESLFYSTRARYRLYANMTWKAIRDAESTINSINPFISKPLEAQRLLSYAIGNYSTYCYTRALEKSDLVNDPRTQITCMENTKMTIFLGQDSAYRLAIRAKHLTLDYLKLKYEEAKNPYQPFLIISYLSFFIGTMLLIAYYFSREVLRSIPVSVSLPFLTASVMLLYVSEIINSTSLMLSVQSIYSMLWHFTVRLTFILFLISFIVAAYWYARKGRGYNLRHRTEVSACWKRCITVGAVLAMVCLVTYFMLPIV